MTLATDAIHLTKQASRHLSLKPILAIADEQAPYKRTARTGIQSSAKIPITLDLNR
ncbi:hypothetical protein N9222_02515 [Pseudomonadales bacterium]|nr:hypothetical protein [Pseudomonadales bacterium]